MYFFFKIKLIAVLVKLDCYVKSIIPYSENKLNLDVPLAEADLFMMPANHKPIFDYTYSMTVDGEI